MARTTPEEIDAAIDAANAADLAGDFATAATQMRIANNLLARTPDMGRGANYLRWDREALREQQRTYERKAGGGRIVRQKIRHGRVSGSGCNYEVY